MRIASFRQVSRRWLGGIVFVSALTALLLVALGVTGRGTDRAQAQAISGNCAAPVSGSTTCSFLSTTAVVPGGTLVITPTSPTGAAVTGVSPLASGCTFAAGTSTAPATVNCTFSSAGIPLGTALTETLSLPAGTTSTQQIVTYNANGPMTAGAGVPSSTSTAGTCTAGSTAGSYTCNNIPSATTVAGGTLSVRILNQTNNGSVQITAADATAGTCMLNASPVLPTAAGGTATVTYTCGAAQSVPAGSTVSVSVTAAAPMGTTVVAPTETTVSNANGPTSGTPAVPAATTTTAVFTVAAPLVAPTLLAISPASAVGGANVTVTGTSLENTSSVNFGSIAVTPSNVSATSVTAVAPLGVPANTLVNLTVTTPGGTSNPLQFTFLAPGPTPTPTPTPVPTVQPTPTPTPGFSVTYAAGWNIVAGPTGTVITGNQGPLYTYQAGNTAYQIIPSGTPLVAGQGYWAYFPTAATTTIALSNPQTINIPLPAGQFIMVGNPGNTSATLTGADYAVVFNPVSNGYTPSTTLSPGQGVWVFSFNGGTLAVTNAPR